MKGVKDKNVLGLEIRSEEGRCAIAIDLGFLTRAERMLLFSLLQSAQNGAEVGFSVRPTEDGRSKALSFLITDPLAPTVSTTVHNVIKSSINGSAS